MGAAPVPSVMVYLLVYLTRITAVILYGLATRADARTNAYELLPKLYRQAKINWV